MMNESTAVRPLWTVHDVATFLGVPVGTIYQWRVRGEGPPAIRLGRHLRYDRAAVLAWVEQQSEAV
jgi:excisionase family DNA binding protein